MGRHHGLTLVEVLISVLMLGAGLASVASLIPIAGTIQRRTYDDMLSQQVGDSIASTIESRGFHLLDVVDPTDPLGALGKVVAMNPRVLDEDDPQDPTDALIDWGLGDRCYPSAIDNDPAFLNRSYYWVPLVRRANTIDWQVFVFVLKKEEGVTYGQHPSTSANPDDPEEIPVVDSVDAIVDPLNNNSVLTTEDLVGKLGVGDQVLDSEGQIHTVLGVTGTSVKLDGVVSPTNTAIWYAPRSKLGSPTRNILTLSNGVVVR